jgi:chemotaxis protein histidine kinase CheA
MFMELATTMLPQDEWAFNVNAVVHAVKRFTDRLAAEAAQAAALQRAALEQQALQQLEDQQRAAAEQLATQEAQAEAERQYAEKQSAQLFAEQEHQAAQLLLEQHQQQAADQRQREQEEQTRLEAERLAALAVQHAKTPVQLTPTEGIPEAHASAWRGGRPRRFRPLATPDCLEGVPELHESVWHENRAASDTSSEQALEQEPSHTSLAATPPMLSTGLAGVADKVAGDVAHNRDIMRWPSMRATSIGAHPARSPALDAVPVPAHPILVPSPDPAPAAEPRIQPSPVGSISLDGAMPDNDQGEEDGPAWFMQPTGHTPSGHANAACSADFPTPETDASDANIAGPSHVPQVLLRQQYHENKRAREDANGAQQWQDFAMGEDDFGANDDYYGCAHLFV